MGIMQDLEEVVGKDQDDYIPRPQSVFRTSLGSLSNPTNITQVPAGKKKTRSRSLYYTPADHAYPSRDSQTRKRSSSSMPSTIESVITEPR